MRTKEELVKLLKAEMPFVLGEATLPYIYEAMEIYASQSPIPAEVIEQIRGLKWNGGFMNADAIVAMTIDKVLSILESHQQPGQETCKMDMIDPDNGKEEGMRKGRFGHYKSGFEG
jgi:hypothetical protein